MANLNIPSVGDAMTSLEAFIEPARARTGIWRPILGILLIVAFFLLGLFLVFSVTAGASILAGDIRLLYSTLGGVMEDGGTPWSVLFVLACFFGIWAGVFVVGRILHGQPFGTFFSPDRRFHSRLFLKGAAFGVCCSAIFIAIGFQITDDIRPGLELRQWAVFLVPVIALTFIQATAEELLFRGYLLQQLAVRSRHWLVWAALPSFLFGLGHFSPDLPGGGGYYYVASTFLIGLTFCAMVWRSGSLWPAIGLHVANNIVYLTVMGMVGIGTGTQLWWFGQTDLIPLFQLDVVMSALMLVFLLAPTGRIFGPGRRANPKNPVADPNL